MGTQGPVLRKSDADTFFSVSIEEDKKVVFPQTRWVLKTQPINLLRWKTAKGMKGHKTTGKSTGCAAPPGWGLKGKFTYNVFCANDPRPGEGATEGGKKEQEATKMQGGISPGTEKTNAGGEDDET